MAFNCIHFYFRLYVSVALHQDSFRDVDSVSEIAKFIIIMLSSVYNVIIN